MVIVHYHISRTFSGDTSLIMVATTYRDRKAVYNTNYVIHIFSLNPPNSPLNYNTKLSEPLRPNIYFWIQTFSDCRKVRKYSLLLRKIMQRIYYYLTQLPGSRAAPCHQIKFLL